METMRRVKRISKLIAKELNISGPFNIQFLAKENAIKVIECNLRASRSFPFISKVLKINFIDLATRIMLGLPVEKPHHTLFDIDYVGIKASQFSFSRLQKADPVLGVDMVSTGEVGCLGNDTDCAILKAMISVGQRIPDKGKGILLSTGTAKQKSICSPLPKNYMKKDTNSTLPEVLTKCSQATAYLRHSLHGPVKTELRKPSTCYTKKR